jgi:hypothetical protein
MASGNWRWTGLACGVALFAMGGCEESPAEAVAALRGQTTHVRTLIFAATTVLPDNPPPPLHVTIVVPATAQDACAATFALPTMPAGTSNCPADFGVSYSLYFEGGAGEGIMSATLDPSGCEQVQIADESHVANLWAGASPDYWSRLCADLGVDETEIYPYLPPPYQPAQ